MSYSTVLTALQTRLATVSGLVSVLKYVPAAINDTPMVYLLLDSAAPADKLQFADVTYQITARLMVKWQDNEQAELTVIPYVDSIPDVIRANPHLGVTGAGAPFAQIESIEGLWVTVANVEYRAMDFTISVRDKQVR